MEESPLSDAVMKRFWEQTGIPLWKLLAGDVPVHRLAEAQVPVHRPARDPSASGSPVCLPRQPPETAVDEATLLRCVSVPATGPSVKQKRVLEAPQFCPQLPPIHEEAPLAPAVAWSDFTKDVDAIENGDPALMTPARFESSIPLKSYRRASDLMRASALTAIPEVREKYVREAERLVAPNFGFNFSSEPCGDSDDSDDAYVQKPGPCALEQTTKRYRDWKDRALSTKLVPVDADANQLKSMNFYACALKSTEFPTVDELVDGTWTPTPTRVPQAVMTVPSNPEGLDNAYFYRKGGIGHTRIPDYEIEAEWETRAAKRRAISSGISFFDDEGFDPFGPEELGGMPPAEPLPTFEMADMLKKRPHSVADFRVFDTFGMPENIYVFVYDELCPPLMAVAGMLTITALFHQRGTKTRAFDKFPWTEKLEYAGPHDKGPLFAPVDTTPQAIMDNDHMRAYIAPAQTPEPTDFLVRMRGGKIVEIVPICNRVAVGQTFPKHRDKNMKKELANIFFNRLLPCFFPPGNGMGRPQNLDRLLKKRPILMNKKEAEKTIRTFTKIIGPRLVEYGYAKGIPEPKKECAYTLALLNAADLFNRVKKFSTPIQRAIDPMVTIGVFQKFLSGAGLLLCGGWGAPDPWSVNLSGLQTLKSGASQAKEDLALFPEIVGGMYPQPRPKDSATGKEKKRREGSSSDRRRMTRSDYAAELLSLRSKIRRDSEDGRFLDEVLDLIRNKKDTTSDRWRIIRFLKEHDTADPTLHMSQNALRRFSMEQVCARSCQEVVHALYALACTGTASIDTLLPGQKYAHELKTRELIKAPYLRKFTYWVMYSGGKEVTFSAGNNSEKAWAYKTVYTAKKLVYFYKLLKDFSNRLFHGTADNDGLRAEIADIQEKVSTLENDLLAGMPLLDDYAKKLLQRAKTGRL